MGYVINSFKRWLKGILQIDRIRIKRFFRYDEHRFLRNCGKFNGETKETIETEIILHYHVLEKGITMPCRHLPFGKSVAGALTKLILKYESLYGVTSSQCNHAIRVLAEYLNIHETNRAMDDDKCWLQIKELLRGRSNIMPARQVHYSRSEYFANKNRCFYDFAHSRHSVRNFGNRILPFERIERSVELAMTAPSACNRQQMKVRCVVNRSLCSEILELQGGNRGFGHLADKVIVLTANLRAEMLGSDRNDAFINAGIFLMNLSYALHYEEVAHCILTWSVSIEKDVLLRQMCSIGDEEVIVALICCGEAPDEFDVASSPRRDVKEVLSIVK